MNCLDLIEELSSFLIKYKDSDQKLKTVLLPKD